MKHQLSILLFIGLLTACQPTPSPSPTITRTGILSNATPIEETVTGPQQEHHWVFRGTANQAAEILFRAEGNLPSISVRAPDGDILREVRSQAYQNTMALDIILPEDGNYAIVVSMLAEGTSAYWLSLQEAGKPSEISPTVTNEPEAGNNLQPTELATDLPRSALTLATNASLPPRVGTGTRLTSHQPILGEITDSGASERYTIVGRAGDVISISVSAVEGSPVDPAFELFTPTGDVLAEADDSFGTQDAILTGIQLPATGAYILFTSDAGSATGLYELSFGFGLTTRRQIQAAPVPDVPVSGLLNTPAVQDAWPVSLNLGDIISAAVVVDDLSGLDPVLQLVSPAGQIIYTDDNSGGGRNAALREIIAPASGVFLLSISPAHTDSYGPYRLIWRYDAVAPSS